jgi:Tfp pilus assembly protein PilN
MRAVNLLPADLRGAVKAPAPVTPAPEENGGSTGAFFALGALALCVLGLAGYILTTNDIKQAESDLAALDARSQVLVAETARLKPYADFAALAQARVTTVNDLAGQRFDWEGAFRDLARALPDDVSVQTLGGTISSAAGGGNPLRASINAPAIELVGCTSSQNAVARMMARLRAVNGVTRVSLSNAERKKTEEAPVAVSDSASATAAAAPTGCEGEGKSGPSDFSVVMFFENDLAVSTDPAAAGAVAGTPPGGVTTAGGESTPAATETPAPTAGATPTPQPTENVPTSTGVE